jgi:hypothetical protein
VGRFLAEHSAEEVGEWFERHAPLCYYDCSDPTRVVGEVLLREDASSDGEALAAGLIWLAAKLRWLDYPIHG